MPWCCCCAGGAPIYSVGARPQAAKSNREAQLQLQRCRVASAPAASRMPSAPSTLLYTVRYTSHTAVCARRAWTYRHTNRTVMRLIYSPCAAAAPVHRARASTCGTDDGRAGVSAVAAAAAVSVGACSATTCNTPAALVKGFFSTAPRPPVKLPVSLISRTFCAAAWFTG